MSENHEKPAGAAGPAGTPRQQARRQWLMVLAVVVVGGALAYGAWHQFFAGSRESTDDAYVGGDQVMITARDPGTVIAR